jgi:precorrin-6B methylase 2
MSSMKTLVKELVGSTARTRFGWVLYRGCGQLSDYFGRIYGHAQFTRQVKKRDEELLKVVRELFPNLTVGNGPFKGMRYPAAQSYGSMLLPKLLGSYESELHPALETVFANEYSAIVDIGCAEGYYAIGLALRFPRAEVYAFDTSEKARQMCAEMAVLTGLQDRIHIGSFCDERSLRSIPLGEKALIISDCEGYENVLFTRELAEFLEHHDLIVEAHDFIDIEISPNLLRVFSNTHDVDSIPSTDDIEKAHTYQYSELRGYTTGERYKILGEHRPGIMKWLVMTSNKSTTSSGIGALETASRNLVS